MLKDPIELDGKRRQCAAGEQPVALIDLDPMGGVFAPATPGSSNRVWRVALAVRATPAW